MSTKNTLVPAAEVFKHIDQKYGKMGAVLRGYRLREGLTQEQLAKKLKALQSHVSQMEHSKRPIGKAMAKKLAKIFNTDYRIFL
jgi:transcriptional regulator with XRE-family HTH domain